MADLIEIDPEEEIAAIRAKVLSVPSREVIMLVPRGTRALQGTVGARVIARAVVDHHLRLAIVTRDGSVRRHAQEVGLSVYGRVQDAQSAKRWRTPREPRAILGPPRKRKAELLAHIRPEGRSWSERLLGVLLLLALLAMVGAGSVLLIPEGHVEVKPAQKSLAAEVRLSVLPGLDGVDYQRVAIPGRRITTVVQGTWSQPTVSRKDAPDQKATGLVLFINQSSAPLVIPPGTVVSTGSGVPIRFRTTEQAVLDGGVGATVEVPIEAIDPGPQGNVDPYLINTVAGTLATQVQVINEQPTAGGSVRQVGVVTNVDKEQLFSTLLKRLESEAHATLQGTLQPGEIAPRDTLRLRGVLNEYYDKMLGDIADQLTLTLRAEFEEIAFSSADVSQIALAGLKGVVPDNYILSDDDLSFQISSLDTSESGMLSFTVTARGIATAALDPEQVRAAVVGLTPEEAEAQLNEKLPLAAPARVAVNPSWSATLPHFAFRVNVHIQE